MATISVITVTKNSSETIGRAVQSVRDQQAVEFEHIIKDACSDDATCAIALAINPSVCIVRKSDSGIYDAMNQGVIAAKGDIVAFLNSDDYYVDNHVLFDVVNTFDSGDCDFVYANISMVSSKGRIVREWRTGVIEKQDFLKGCQIPHPAFFCKKKILDQLEIPFDASYKISADLKQQLILINKMGAREKYIDRVTTVMAVGGESTKNLSSYFRGWKECARAYREVIGKNGWVFVFWKVFGKVKGILGV